MRKYMAFCGKAGSGKTTSCLMLSELYNSATIILPWAFEIKRIAREEFGWDGNKDDKGRRLLQVIGTECGRNYGGDNFWIDKWQNRIDKITNTDLPSNLLILNDDTRFDNEAKHIKNNGGMVIELYGRENDLGENSKHSSENGVDKDLIDIRIDNSGSIESLKYTLAELLKGDNDAKTEENNM